MTRPVEAPVSPPAPLGTPLKGRLTISSPVPVEDDPFAELQAPRGDGQKPSLEAGWSWKQVLSTLDAKGAQAEAARIAGLLKDMGLDNAIDDTMLDRLRVLATRSRDQARRSTREALPVEVRAMRRRLTADPDLRASIIRFVEARREAAARGRLIGNEARVYLVVDAALEA